MQCAQLSPSACNFQPWRFYVVVDGDVKQKVQETYNREWFKAAPAYIVVSKRTSQSWKRPSDGKDSGDIDASIAAEHICLAAAEVGLGTCWVCNFNLQDLSVALNCADDEEPIAIFPIGYIDVDKSKVPDKKRKPLADTTKWI